ncbi:MAG: helix-turn-helix transcriptional regulator [Eubacteriales bacterium]|nr:helix-turn-helix transcriptional regulator [Eubacteriales bacterium]
MYRSIPRHRHGNGDWEMHYISGGIGKIEIEGNTFAVKKGDCFFVGPQIEHMQISDRREPMQEETVYFHFGEEVSFSEQKYICCENAEVSVGSIFERIFQEMEDKKNGYISYVGLLLEQLLLELVRCCEKQAGFSSCTDTITMIDTGQMQDYLVEKAFLYDYADLSLEGLAAKVGLSARQMQRHLKECYNSTFVEMRRQARMEAAKLLLVHTDQSVYEIAAEVGYSTAEHFSAVFSAQTGCSPRTYRKKQQQLP